MAIVILGSVAMAGFVIALRARQASKHGGKGTAKLTPEFEDTFEDLYSLRKWLQEVLAASGAEITGGGCGCGQADVDIRIAGQEFYVTIKPAVV